MTARGAAAAVLLLACSGAQGPVAAAGGEAEGCAQARELRREATALYAAGKLDRAHRTLGAANLACAREAASSWGLELATLVDLGARQEASALAREMARSPEASTADAARARAWLAAPEEEAPVSGEQLLAAALAKQAEGDRAAAQKLFDRARLDLEARAGAAMRIEAKGGVWSASAMSWAADGKTLVVAADGVLRAFDTNGFVEVMRLHPGGAGFSSSVAFSPDGRVLAVGVGEGGAALWDVAGAREVGKLESGVPGALRTLLFSPDGVLLAGRSWEDSRIPAWRVASRQPLAPFQPVRGELEQSVVLCGQRGGSGGPGFWPGMLSFSPDGSSLLGTCAQTLGVWAPGSGQTSVVKALKGAAADELYSVTYHPDGRHAVAGTEAGLVVAWDVGAGRRLGSLEAHEFNPLVQFSRDGKRLVSAAVDGAVRSFAFASGGLKPVASYRVPVSFVDAVAIHPDATKVALAGSGALVVQDAVTGEVTHALPAPLGVSALAVDSRLTRLAFGTDTGAVGLLDIAGGSLRWSKGHTQTVTAIAFSPDGASLASVSRDQTARVWDVATGQARLVLSHAGPLNAVVYRRDGQVLVTAGDTGAVQLWDAASGKVLRQLHGSSCAIAALGYSPDGSVLVASAVDHALLRWNAETYVEAEAPAGALPQPGRACANEVRPSAQGLAFSSDGALVASAAPAGHAVELWGARSGERQGSLTDPEPSFHPSAVALSPRDPLAVAAGGGRIRAWRLPEQTPLSVVAPPGGAESLVFSTDGRFLLGATPRGSVAVWQVGEGGSELKPVLTLELVDETSALALSADGLVQWFGPARASAACVLGSRLYPVELCEERFAAPGLVAKVLSASGSGR